MKIEKIEYVNQDYQGYKDDLLKRLIGEVFHLTTKAAFKKIREDGYVRHNKDGSLGLNTSSGNSFGRKRGWVCLLDLRNKAKSIIEDTLTKYNFFGPSWFVETKTGESNLVYLFLNPQKYQNLIPNKIGFQHCFQTGNYEQLIPETECWLSGNIPLDFFSRALCVRIVQKRPKG